MVHHRSRSTALGLLLLPGLASAAPQVIGDPVGRAGLFPLLATPPGNAFVPTPGAGNEYTPDPTSHTHFHAALGLALFWDEQLSSDNTMACATCHLPEFAGADPRPRASNLLNGFGSSGVLPMDANRNYVAGTPTIAQQQATPVIAPTVLNSAFSGRLLWQSGAGPGFTPTTPGLTGFGSNAALEAQAVGPIANTIEMAHPGFGFVDPANNTTGFEDKLGDLMPLALATPGTIPPPVQPFLNSTYDAFFDAVFSIPGTPIALTGGQGVTRDRMAVAIAAYERTLVTNQAPVDTQGFSAQGSRGFDILQNSSCFSCHSFTTAPQRLPGGGFADARDALFSDFLQRAGLNFPEQPGATGMAQGNPGGGIRTPSLRNLPLRRTFAHNGFFDSFDRLLDFYDGQLATVPTFQFVSFQPGATSLTAAERSAVEAFFDDLTDPRLTPPTPGGQLGFPFWHPDLYSDRVPFGTNEPDTHPGTPSAPGGTVPDIILHVPLMPGSDQFKVAVRDAPPLSILSILGMSPAVLPPPMAGGGIMLDPVGLTTIDFFAPNSTDANGFKTAIWPDTGTLITPGSTFSFQWAVIDMANGQLAFSNAASVLVQ